MVSKRHLRGTEPLGYVKPLALPNCPLCGEPDSVGHLLGGCTHRECVAMKIERHNAAVRMVQDTITCSSRHGGCYTIMDACPANNLPEGVQGTRLPSWLLPDGHPDADKLQKCRPDIVMRSSPHAMS